MSRSYKEHYFQEITFKKEGKYRSFSLSKTNLTLLYRFTYQ